MSKDPDFTPLSPSEETRRYAAYLASMSDSDACRILGGVSGSTYVAWRISRGLPAKNLSYGTGHRISDEEDALRRKAYDEWPSDVKAAQALNMSLQSYHTWRVSRKLPRKNPPFPERLSKEVKEEMMRIYLTSRTDAEAAERMMKYRGGKFDAHRYHEWRRWRRLPLIGDESFLLGKGLTITRRNETKYKNEVKEMMKED